MRERHLDGTVLISGAGGAVFESLARPDLFITDAERANVIGSRRKDRDAALIDTITTTLSSRSSLLLPCDASTRVLELLVLLDQHWSFARLKFPICLLSRTGREMLTFVRSMMEWLGGTVSKEDVGEETSGKRSNKRRRDDDADEEAIGAFALRFKHLEFFPNPEMLLETYSRKTPNSSLRFLHHSRTARHDRYLRISQLFQIMSSFSLAVASKEHLGASYLSVGINLSVPRISGIRASSAAVLCLTVLSTYA
jgi:Cft2 family RNA processing exonuclease